MIALGRYEMECDIGRLLADWPYDEDDNIRRIVGRDGLEKIQVRLPLGVEQYEVDGRPDGMKPEGCESYLCWYESVAAREGPSWRLNAEAFARLHEEGLLYYFRYLLFFRLGEYDLCARDTSRNLRLADFVRERADGDEMGTALEQYRPYILRMRAVSLAVKAAKEGGIQQALDILTEAVEDIESLGPVDTPIYRLEKARSLVALRDLSNQLKRQNEFSPLDRLKEELARAVSEENYELAAVLRDKIRRLGEECEV